MAIGTSRALRLQAMSGKSQDQSQDPGEELDLLPWETATVDEDGALIIEWDADAHAKWCEKWAPSCPDGNPVRVRRPLGSRERNRAELELRVALGGNDLGVCDVIVDERADEVYVRVLVCYDPDEPKSHDYSDWPVRVWLDRPRGERAVIDVDSDEELRLYTPAYLDNVPQRDHGYRPAGRRR
jgi:hypothetical protein